jgi:serine-type D-Ala-D-Ala carboxypeptidase
VRIKLQCYIRDMNESRITQIIEEAAGQMAPAIVVQVRREGKVVYEEARGWLDPESCQRPARLDTLFDLASVTKLFTTTAFMAAVEQGWHKLDDPVSKTIPEFSGLRAIAPYEAPLQPGEFVQPKERADEQVDAGKVTYRQLLSHSSGLPAWRPLFYQPDAGAALRMALGTPFFYPTGTRSVYSDIGLITLGLALERTIRWRLDELVRESVTAPLGLAHTRFLPLSGGPYDTANLAPTELCPWRKHRVLGEVDDENAARLGGIAGHAGLFSTADDLARFGESYLNPRKCVLSKGMMAEMTSLQAEEGPVRRGLGFALWSPDPESSGYPYSPQAFGHTGFTGTSLWMDPPRKLVVAILTNRVYYGRDPKKITAFRATLQKAIVEEVDQCA